MHNLLNCIKRFVKLALQLTGFHCINTVLLFIPSACIPSLCSKTLLLMQHFHPTFTFRPLVLFPPILYLLSLHPPRMFLAVFVCLLLPPLTPSGFFNVMLEVWRAPNYYILSCLILLTLFVSRNLTLTHLFLSGSLNILLCNLIARTLVLKLFLLVPCTLAAVSSFLSSKAYPSLNFL